MKIDTHPHSIKDALEGAVHIDVYTVLEAMRGDAWLCGGAVLRAMLGGPIGKDYDIFCLGKDQAEEAITRLRDLGWKHEYVNAGTPGDEYGEDTEVRAHLKKDGVEQYIDVIGSNAWICVEDALDTFDFDIVQVGWDGDTFAVGTPFFVARDNDYDYDRWASQVDARIAFVANLKRTTPERMERYRREFGFRFVQPVVDDRPLKVEQLDVAF